MAFFSYNYRDLSNGLVCAEKVGPGLLILSPQFLPIWTSIAFWPALLPVQLFPQFLNHETPLKNHLKLPIFSLNLRPLNKLLFLIVKSFKNETISWDYLGSKFLVIVLWILKRCPSKVFMNFIDCIHDTQCLKCAGCLQIALENRLR